MDNLKENQVIYVLTSEKTSYKKAKIIELKKSEGKYGDEKLNPKRYMNIIVKYEDSNTNGTVTFYPEDFGNIIFISEDEVQKIILKN